MTSSTNKQKKEEELVNATLALSATMNTDPVKAYISYIQRYLNKIEKHCNQIGHKEDGTRYTKADLYRFFKTETQNVLLNPDRLVKEIYKHL